MKCSVFHFAPFISSPPFLFFSFLNIHFFFREIQPRYLGLCFDLPNKKGRTVRHELSNDYKMNRKEVFFLNMVIFDGF